MGTRRICITSEKEMKKTQKTQQDSKTDTASIGIKKDKRIVNVIPFFI